jgi:membrane protease YdiL (CAAX protease family)
VENGPRSESPPPAADWTAGAGRSTWIIDNLFRHSLIYSALGDHLKIIKGIFINPSENRFRAMWRLLLQVFLALLISIVGQLLLVLILPPDISAAVLAQAFLSSEMSYLPIILSFLGTAAGITASIWLAGKYLDKRPFNEFGLRINRDWWRDFCFGAGLGAVLMLLIFLTELLAGWISVEGFFVTENPSHSFLASIWLPLILFMTVGFYEELLSRGYQLTNLAEGLTSRTIPPKPAIILAATLSSVIFAILHISNPNASPLSTFNIFLAGLFLAFGYLFTGQLSISIGLHISWNFMQGNVFGFPVSGAQSIAATFIKIQQGGPSIWTGGVFGPEGGILGTISPVLGMAIIYIYLGLRNNKIGLFTQLSEPPAHGLRNAVPKSFGTNNHAE